MKFLRFRDEDGHIRLGYLEGERVAVLPAGFTLSAAMQGVDLPGTEASVPLSEVSLLAPLDPGKILCVGRNYVDHAAELGNDVPSAPLIFAKLNNSVNRPGGMVHWRTSVTQQVDWEGELVVVMGRRAQAVSEDEALDYVFGYTVANDVSARDIQDSESQWVRAKSPDTFCPLGPWIVTHDELPDPHALDIRTEVSGEVVQNSNTGLMVYRIPYLIAHLSQSITLDPGDILLTGTPSGVGKGMKPPRFLKTGDTVSVTVSGIGTLTNPFEAID